MLAAYFSLGLNNFYKTILDIFVRAGIKIYNKNGNVIYPELNIDQVIRRLHDTVLSAEKSVDNKADNRLIKNPIELQKSWAKNFNLKSDQKVKLQKLLVHHSPMLGPIMANESSYRYIPTKNLKLPMPMPFLMGSH